VTAQPELLPLPPEPPAKPQPVTAGHMLAMLRRHYLPDEARPAGIFASEIQAPGTTLRKADLIWLGCTAATGSQLVGHEVKVSRQDVLAELADLTKSDPWQRYCDRWWLVIPNLMLIRGLELPDPWGVLTPPSGRRHRSMTVHRPAPLLQPAEQAPALRTIAAWVHWRHRDLTVRATQIEADTQRQWKELQEQRIYDTSRHDPHREIATRIVTALGGSYGRDEVGSWKQQVKVDDVVAALKELGAVYRRRDDAKRALDDYRQGLKTAHDRIGRLLAETDGPKT
jgi:hypothetical protein